MCSAFTTGRSQAVLLPVAFRFQGTAFFVRRDPWTGEVVLSPKPISWYEFLERTDQTGIPSDFMVYREDIPADGKDLF